MVKNQPNSRGHMFITPALTAYAHMMILQSVHVSKDEKQIVDIGTISNRNRRALIDYRGLKAILTVCYAFWESVTR